MMLNNIVKKLVKNGMDDVVLTFSEQESSQLKFSDSKIVKTGTEFIENLSIFVAKDKKIAVTSIRDISPEAIEKAIIDISNFVKNLKPNKNYFGINEKKYKYNEIEDSYDKRIPLLGEKTVDIVKESVGIAESNGIKRCAGVLETYNNKVNLATSNGIEASDNATQIYLSFRSLISKSASGHKVACARTLKDFDYKKAAEKSSMIAKDSLKQMKAPYGKYDVLFDPLPFADLLNSVGEASSIFSVEAGLSFLSDKLNKKISSSIFALSDNGLYPGGYHSFKFDNEGVPTMETKIINKGILKNYLHNTSSARRYKTKTTANAGLISPEPHNLIVEGGDYSEDELISSVKEGIYITNTWYTRFQSYLEGNFSTIPRDGIFYIKNGKIKYAIKGIRVSENILNILKNIKSLGKKREQIISWSVSIPVILPPILVKEVNITKPLEQK